MISKRLGRAKSQKCRVEGCIYKRNRRLAEAILRRVLISGLIFESTEGEDYTDTTGELV